MRSLSLLADGLFLSFSSRRKGLLGTCELSDKEEVSTCRYMTLSTPLLLRFDIYRPFRVQIRYLPPLAGSSPERDREIQRKRGYVCVCVCVYARESVIKSLCVSESLCVRESECGRWTAADDALYLAQQAHRHSIFTTPFFQIRHSSLLSRSNLTFTTPSLLRFDIYHPLLAARRRTAADDALYLAQQAMDEHQV